jgi:hypothetical protein
LMVVAILKPLMPKPGGTPRAPTKHTDSMCLASDHTSFVAESPKLRVAASRMCATAKFVFLKTRCPIASAIAMS